MANPDHARIPWHPLAVGATRPALVKGFLVPAPYLLGILVPPFIMMMITVNVAWLLLMLPLTRAMRDLAGRDHNHPRVLWLSFRSGALLARREAPWHGDTRDPLQSARQGLEGLL